MVKKIAFAIMILMVFVKGASAEDRIRLDREAKAAFLNLHFFADGRGMHTAPGLIKFYESISGRGVFSDTIRNRWGMNVLDKNKIVGLYNVRYKNMDVGVLGCVACHSSKAAGQFIVGLGNKRIDVFRVGQDVLAVQKLYDKVTINKDEEFVKVEKNAIAFAQHLAVEKIGNLTQGLVPVSFVRGWFYRQAGVPMPENITKGAVKVPALWGYGIKRQVGQFSDGYGNGILPGWAIAVELTAGQLPETVRGYLPKVVDAEDALGHFLPPAYPFAIDQGRAARGQAVFTKNCQGCHGTYERDSQGLPVFKAPRWIPLHMVQTDSDRLESNTPEFNELVKNNPLSDILQHTELGRGYFAPRLEAVWARFPYLHNASVPSIAALLTPPHERPQLFALDDAGEAHRFDQETLGLTVPAKGSLHEYRLKFRASQSDRAVYNTKHVGQTAVGHGFGTTLTAGEKRDLVEYLKTL
ncbi:MAG TPA: hypothetical protein VFV50_00400 [Bdellovibrionales bacterium]|nr:hypothetical protein [Bdellovibrionales bacterium]